jgi:hypothetical protein
MIDRLIENKAAVLEALSNHQHTLALLTETEWDKLGKVANLLRPCEEATKLLGEKYVTCFCVLPIVVFLRKALRHTDEDSGYSSRFKQAVVDDVGVR